MTDADRIEPLDWDSEFFGLKIGRGRVNTADQVDELADAARDGGFDCVYLLLESDDFDGRNAAVRHGFRSVGHRVTFRADSIEGQVANTATIRPAEEGDLVWLEPLARASFGDSRFFWDPGFPDERAAELYAVWLRKSVTSSYHDATFCAVVDDQPAAFVTCDIHELSHHQSVGQIGLIGVGERARGRGIGSALVEHVHRFYRSRGVSAAEVVTHGSNLAAQRLYGRLGYRPHRIQSWFHWWSD